MKIEIWKKLGGSFAGLGVSSLECAEAMKRLSKIINKACAFRIKYEREARHRRRCILIAFAMSQTCSPKKRHILWNLFRNT